MQAAPLLAASGQGDIDAPGRELAARPRRCSSSARRASIAALHALLGLVDALAGGRTLGRRQRTERLQLLGERAFLAEPAHADLIERREVAAAGDLVERLLDERSSGRCTTYS